MTRSLAVAIAIAALAAPTSALALDPNPVPIDSKTYNPWDTDEDGIPDRDDTIDPWADDYDGDGIPDDEDTFNPFDDDDEERKDSDGDGIPDIDDTIDPWANDRSCTIKCLSTSVTTVSPTLSTTVVSSSYTRLAIR